MRLFAPKNCSPWSRPPRRQLAAIVCALSACSAALAEEPVLEFLHAAQDQGYGEAALDYLANLQAGGKLPPQLAETLDLELSRSYRIAVAESFNATEAEQRMAKSKAHLDKFLKEHPDHAEVGRAIEAFADISLDRALDRIRLASGLKDPEQKEKQLLAARADLEEARPRLAEALTRHQKRFAMLRKAAAPPTGKKKGSTSTNTKKQRQAQQAALDAETAWLDCRFKIAKLEFYLAQTYDPKSPERMVPLAAAAKAFDSIFQGYRENLVGMHAHLWHGRVADAMGDDILAMDIYDEVLAVSPEGREKSNGLEPLFAQVQYYRGLVTLRKFGPADFLAEAQPWLDAHKTWDKFDGYQGVRLEVAKATLAGAAQLPANRRASTVQKSLTTLADIGRRRGEHQHEAILLRRQNIQGEAVDLTTIKTFDEALALGESAAEVPDWPRAVPAFARALELKSTTRDQKQVAHAELRLDQGRYQLAAADFGAGKVEESLAAAEQIVRERPKSAIAPPAAALAVSSALSIYSKAQDKAAALTKLQTIANETIERWPDKPEADDARIALGQASLVQGDLPGAIAVFEKVNPRSLRYGAALFLAGQTHWRRYLATKAKAAEAANSDDLNAERAQAEQQLAASLAAAKKTIEAGQPLPRATVETQLLLAEVKLDGGAAKEAGELADPLLAALVAEKPTSLDNTALRIFLTAARAAAASGDYAKAGSAGGQLADLAPDEPTANGVAISILKLIGEGWKQAEATAIEARSGANGSSRAAAEAEANARKQLVAQLNEKLATRKQQSLAAQIYLGDTAAQLGKTDTARTLYQSILSQGESDATFRQTHAAALTRIRSQLVGLLRQKGQFAEGLAEAEKLIKEFPRALEPKMEKGRLLQGWAEEEPQRFNEAVAHWTMLRNLLAGARKKPPEYYEVVYNAASCLCTESLKTSDRKTGKTKALQAEQLLKATLVLSPKLDGPESVARYNELLKRARQLQQG